MSYNPEQNPSLTNEQRVILENSIVNGGEMSQDQLNASVYASVGDSAVRSEIGNVVAGKLRNPETSETQETPNNESRDQEALKRAMFFQIDQEAAAGDWPNERIEAAKAAVMASYEKK